MLVKRSVTKMLRTVTGKTPSNKTQALSKNRNMNIWVIDTLNQLFSSQPAIACSKLTIETLEQGVKYVQS